MVAGGPYGLEDLIGKAGYRATLVILLLTPLLWSIPTALMVSELTAALPCEGGFYVWVRRGLGRFWGFQESWLTLTGSAFEMALYPTPFLAIIFIGATRKPPVTALVPVRHMDLAGGIVIAMWNYMGWDNLSTIADEVDQPQTTYPLAMFGSVTLVIASYLFPVMAVAAARLDPGTWTTGSWVDAGQGLGGSILARSGGRRGGR